MKKGFTLIELLTIILILVILLIIGVPAILRVINESKENTYQSQKDLMLSAAEKYVVQNEEKILWIDNVTYIYLKELQNEGFINRPVKNPKGGIFPGNTLIMVTRLLNRNLIYVINSPIKLVHKINKNVLSGAIGDGTYESKNGSKYFVGPNPNNWIEFGQVSSADKTPLMWRVIKVDSEGIKIIYEGAKNGDDPPIENGRVTVAGTRMPAWDENNTNKWVRPATLNSRLQQWYNQSFYKENRYDFIQPINWCVGASGQGIDYPSEQVFLKDYINTECVDGIYDGGNFLGKTVEKTGVGLIRVSDYLNTSNADTCTGSYFTGIESELVDRGKHCGRIDNEEGRTNFLWKPEYPIWTFTAVATNSNFVWRIHPTGHVGNEGAINAAAGLRPVINLKYDIFYDSGKGTLKDPYKIKE